MNPDVDRIIQEAAPPNGEQNASTVELPEIDAGIGDLDAITRLAWSAIEARNVPPRLFLHGTLPVRIEHDDHGAARLVELTVDRLRHELATFALWRKETRHGIVDVPPPMHVVRNVLATPNLHLPTLTHIVHTPVFAPDGKLVELSGYDHGSGIYLSPYDQTLTLLFPVHPTRSNVERARNLIDELLCDFPYVGVPDRTHSVCLFLEPFVRAFIAGPTPNYVVDAPCPGSGKGLAVTVLLFAALGSSMAMVTEAKDDEEWRKRITAVLREGRAVIILDNLTRPLTSGVVANAITTPRWADRLLGKNEIISLPVRTTWVTTGNNVALSLEIARRSVHIRLDPKRDRPWLRDGFRHPNLVAWVQARRTDFIWAAVVLIRAWLNAGRPAPKATPLGSFECWTHVMGGIVEHAGFPDFLGNMFDFYETTDTEGAAWRAFTATWWETHGDKAVGITELFLLAQEIDGFHLGKSKTERGQRTVLGIMLTRYRDRVVGHFRIERAGASKGASLWQVRQLGAPAREREQETAVPQEVLSVDHD